MIEKKRTDPHKNHENCFVTILKLPARENTARRSENTTKKVLRMKRMFYLMMTYMQHV